MSAEKLRSTEGKGPKPLEVLGFWPLAKERLTGRGKEITLKNIIDVEQRARDLIFPFAWFIFPNGETASVPSLWWDEDGKNKIKTVHFNRSGKCLHFQVVGNIRLDPKHVIGVLMPFYHPDYREPLTDDGIVTFVDENGKTITKSRHDVVLAIGKRYFTSGITGFEIIGLTKNLKKVRVRNLEEPVGHFYPFIIDLGERSAIISL